MANHWTRRAFLATGLAALGAPLAPVPVGARGLLFDRRWAPYHALDLKVGDFDRDEAIRRTVWWANEWQPQANAEGRAPFDPRHPGAPGRARRLPGRGKRIEASVLAMLIPNDYSKARAVKHGIARLLALGDAAVQEQLSVDIQLHTCALDHPDRGVSLPSGFEWDWVMTVPHAVAAGYRRDFERVGERVEATPGVELAAERVGGRGWPAGWVSRAAPRTLRQYTIVPDLRIPECRAFLLGRLAGILDELGLANAMLSGKSGWFHGRSRPWVQAGNDRRGGPWLPSPYDGDAYRDANVALVREAVDRFGAERVTWTNTGVPTPAERALRRLPAYTAAPDGGIREHFDRFYGSRESNWTLPLLERRGHFRQMAGPA